ncbi:MAG: maltose alpha-D-glucosyltransferase [Thermoplasmata archaeon]
MNANAQPEDDEIGSNDFAPNKSDATWYKDALIYELHVRAFSDSSGDGQGDFVGLTGKLDYLRDLGVTAVWLLPFYPSPMRDDGYDISDYCNVQPSFGTLRDFRAFLRRAHDYGIRVITELVLNHTSIQHPWFQRARRAAPGSPERDFYIWSDSRDRFAGVRIIFKDFETSNWAFDEVAGAYYFHRFYFHQPDLNYDSPEVQRAILDVLDFWLNIGVDGLRLDAVPYLFKREGTTCENLPETHAFLRKLRAHIDAKFKGRMLLAEANQWPEDAARYFGEGRGDECHTAFHFPLMPRLFMATRTESRFPIVDILEQTPTIPVDSQWVLFLRNHDELTLEMVSDEERDYMYRVYAADPRARVNLGIRRRLAPLLNNDRRLIELMNGLLLSLPGTPVLYYGDEIGMGDNIFLGDRNGVRSPMQWSPDRNAGFSRANPQSLYLPVIVNPEYHFEAVNVEIQQSNPRSLLWHTKRLIALRKQNRVFGRGSINFLRPENARTLAYIRTDGTQNVLVVANLSRFAQSVELDLSAYAGSVPIELTGLTVFPKIETSTYRLSLGAYDFLWFRLEHGPIPGVVAPSANWQPLELAEPPGWETVERYEVRAKLQSVLPGFLWGRRWFRGKGQTPTSVRGSVETQMGHGDAVFRLVSVDVEFATGDPQRYLIPLAFADPARSEEILKNTPSSVLAIFRPGDLGRPTVLFDAAQDPTFIRALVEHVAHNTRHNSAAGELIAAHTEAFRRDSLAIDLAQPVEPVRAEQSNSSARVGERFIVKVFRTIEPGLNPEAEIGEFLTAGNRFPHTAPLLGTLTLAPENGAAQTLATVHQYVPNEGDAWEMTLRNLSVYFDRVRARLATGRSLPEGVLSRFELRSGSTPPDVADLIGPYLVLARLLGVRTAELHRALASDPLDPAFAPEPFDPLYLRSIYQTMQAQRRQAFELLRERRATLAGPVAQLAEAVLPREAEVDARFRALLGRRMSAMRTRLHGDYHLGQVLWTGKDFVIIDFEGEPTRSVSERRIKRSPLRDVAGMLRSFDYAANAAWRQLVGPQLGKPDLGTELATAARMWVQWVGAEFLRAYRGATTEVAFLPKDQGEFDLLLQAFVAEKVVYELSYEFRNRPAWVEVPLRGIEYILGPPRSAP